MRKFDKYFNGRTNRTVNGKIRNNMTNHRSIKRETGMGVEAQLDWKENMHYTLSTGEVIELNIFALVYPIQDID